MLTRVRKALKIRPSLLALGAIRILLGQEAIKKVEDWQAREVAQSARTMREASPAQTH